MSLEEQTATILNTTSFTPYQHHRQAWSTIGSIAGTIVASTYEIFNAYHHLTPQLPPVYTAVGASMGFLLGWDFGRNCQESVNRVYCRKQQRNKKTNNM